MTALGADVPAYKLPPDLTVVQVGDLLGGSQDDEAILDDVNEWMTRNPGQWVQLIGNWEARHLGGPRFSHDRRDRVPLPARSIHLLESWWRDGRALTAIALRSSRNVPVLVTHAGLTRQFWTVELGSEPSASRCAARLNTLAHVRRNVAFRPGRMLCDPRASGPPGPVWAMAAEEVWPSWDMHPMPFHQVHGHTSPYFFRARRWSSEIPAPLRDRAVLHTGPRHIWWTSHSGHRIIGIDPGLGPRPQLHDLCPLLLPGARVVHAHAAT